MKKICLFFILANMMTIISNCQNPLSNNADNKNNNDVIQKSSNNQKIKLLDKSVINLSDDVLLNLIKGQADLGGFFYENPTTSYSEINFEIICKQPYRISSKSFCFVIVGVANLGGCHGCSGTNLIAILQFIDSKWQLIHKPINTGSNPRNSWGNNADFDNFYIVGKSTIAIELSGGMGNHGAMYLSRSIYLIDNNQISLVFEGQKYEQNEQGLINEWDIKFIDAGADIYNLLEEKKSEGIIIKSRVLKFNNSSKKFE
ncbi:MAG: hypothetical protein NT127_06250 [Sphingobacteriales bacterium]|nr:hypothetical protein [Sphingobacteriales bacterium]